MTTPGDYDWKWSNEQRDYYRYTWNTDGTWGRVEWGRSRLPDPDSPPTSRPQPTAQAPQAHTYQAGGPAHTTPMQYTYSNPQAPTRTEHVQPQESTQPQYNHQPPHQTTGYQPTTYQTPVQPQTPQQQVSYQGHPQTYTPTTPSNPLNPSYSDSSPPSARSGSTQSPAYSPPNPNPYPQNPQNPRWPPSRRPGQ